MFLKQYYLGCLAHASYLIADEKTGVASVVDPQRDIEQYLEDAAEHGWEIQHVFLTHFHADFLAGHIEFRDRVGAEIHLGARAQAEFEFTPAHDGDVVEFGDVRLKILETPGHTPEGISILVYDLQKNSDALYAVLTGDTLFIGDVGRPDLLASIGVTAAELADMLYESVERLKSLPDETLVYPAHGAGSLCGKNLSDKTVSAIGEQKKFNYALQPMSREEFKRLVTAEQPDTPEYFVYDAIKNRQERTSLEETMQKSMQAIPLDEVLRMRNAGAQLIDVRDAADFEGAHLKGSLQIGLRGKYAPWCGALLDHDRPIIIITDFGCLVCRSRLQLVCSEQRRLPRQAPARHPRWGSRASPVQAVLSRCRTASIRREQKPRSSSMSQPRVHPILEIGVSKRSLATSISTQRQVMRPRG